MPKSVKNSRKSTKDNLATKKRGMTDEELADAYARHSTQVRERNQRARNAAAEIGPLPPVVNPQRKAAAAKSLRVYLESYFPNVFPIQPWADFHLAIIDKMERAILDGGQFVVAIPRGGGKSSLSIRAAMWAISYGYKRFVVVVGASETAAEDLLDGIKAEYEWNGRLFQDFPEICACYKALQGQQKRATSQTLDGKPTRMVITAGQLVLPTIEGSLSSGACLRVAGITGRLRGLQHVGLDGVPIRPDLVLVDDVSTDVSSNSQMGNEKRMALLSGAVLGLAGPGVSISCVATVTVITKGDLADQLLDPEISPTWRSERHGLLSSMPSQAAMTKWKGEYFDELKRSLQETGTIRGATKYYLEHRKELDEGAVATWEKRYNKDEASAIQNAMNLMLRDEKAYWAEYMNSPMKDDELEHDNLREEHIYAKVTGRPRGVPPLNCDKLVLSVDVQKQVLPWVLFAFDESFNCEMIDYGGWPKQRIAYWDENTATPTLEQAYPNLPLETRIYQGLTDLCDYICEREWTREDGEALTVDAVVIDDGWGPQSDNIARFCRECKQASYCFPVKGVFVGPNRKALSSYRKEAGMRIYPFAQLRPMRKFSRQKLLLIDSGLGKSFLRERVLTPRGGKGCLTFAGTKEDAKLLADAYTAQYSKLVIGDRRCDQFVNKVGRHNDHLFDASYYAMAAATMLGCHVMDEQKPAPAPRQPRQPRPQVISAVREKREGPVASPIKYAPSPRPSRQSFSGTISVKR